MEDSLEPSPLEKTVLVCDRFTLTGNRPLLRSPLLPSTLAGCRTLESLQRMNARLSAGASPPVTASAFTGDAHCFRWRSQCICRRRLELSRRDVDSPSMVVPRVCMTLKETLCPRNPADRGLDDVAHHGLSRAYRPMMLQLPRS